MRFARGSQVRLAIRKSRGGHRSPFETCPIRASIFRQPEQDSQVRLAQAFLKCTPQGSRIVKRLAK
jgi:hypothetical protein